MPTTILVLPVTVLSDSYPVGDHIHQDLGSERGSGYWWTNTILRHCDKLFATWQSYDPTTSTFDVWVGTNQLGTGTWLTRYKLTVPSGYKTMDNHGGASIIADSAGYLHLLYGPHNTGMLEAISTNPWDASAFNNPQFITSGLWPERTYSSVVRDNFGTFHLVSRGHNGNDESRLIYQRGTPGTGGTMTTWGQPVVLVSTAKGTNTAHPTDTAGYSLYESSIAVSGQHTLHVAYQMYYDPPLAGSFARAWGYLRSTDGGNTWQDAKGGVVNLPIDNSPINSAHFVQSNSLMDVRVCNITIDPNGDPWVSVLYIKPASKIITNGGGNYDTKLWHLSGGQWSVISLSPFISSFGPTWRVAGGTITFDTQGVLYVAAERVDMNDATSYPYAWMDGTSKEVIVLMSTDMGQTFQVYPVAPIDATRPHWLANIERPTTTAPIAVPALMYTDSLPNNPNFVNQPADIVFAPLYKH